ncbi:hypothetical protein JXA80_13565, partial [bacterium]|nr:hypothetical protein [candidate division CSSED10-310 bacterium]
DDPDTANSGEGSGITDRGCHERCSGTPTPPPWPTPTVTPLPMTIEVDISMPAAIFEPGMICGCTVLVTVDGAAPLTGHPLLVLLDVYGALFFAPSFTPVFDSYLAQYPAFPVGETMVTVIDSFEWPSGAGAASHIVWYAGITDPQITLLRSTIGFFEFGWR